MITELLPRIQALPKADKLRLMQFLVSELAREEDITLLQPNTDYPIWTPFNAAATLLNALKAENRAQED